MNLTLGRVISGAITAAAFLFVIGLVVAPFLFAVVAGLAGIKGQGVCAP